MTVATETRRWRKTSPDTDGWWLFREQSMRNDQRILILDGVVAGDYEFAVFSGKDPDDITDENYWEGNCPKEMTDGTLTRGVWKFDGAINRQAAHAE